MDAVTKERLRVQAAIREDLVSRRALARKAGIRDTVLINALDPNWNPQAETLAALSRALDALGILVKKKEAEAVAGL